jgi:ribonuclease HII
MPYLIGTDEAGYGPNLGPLVITGTLWKVPNLTTELFDLLATAISPNKTSDRIRVCDSKDLYQSSGSIAALETSIFGLLGDIPKNWKQLVKSLGCPYSNKRQEVWLANSQLKLPLKADRHQASALHELFQTTCKSANIELVSVRTATVFANQFNEQVAIQGNKATVLSSTTLNIVRKLLKSTKREDTKIICDKHGGRSKYAGVLQHHLTDQLIRTDEESLATSRYGWLENGRDFNIEFNARGESSLPVAFASMVSKYVREVYMKLWNQFWLQHLPSLKPTKGYPQDAKRFMADIESVRDQLEISRESVWRCR